ncbi:recombination-associated protein RdgC [Myxococcota bacterium]|nr:recombination-associated protein RdgC [Myxococcota bacterium]
MTFSRFRVEQKGERPRDVKRWLARGFKAHAFEPLDKSSDEEVATGWVEIEDRERTDLTPSSLLFGEWVLVSWRVDRIKVPTAAVKDELDAWSRVFEGQNGRPPRRAEKKEEKEHVVQRLRKRAFPIVKTHDVSWNLETNQLQIWTTSKKTVDEIVEALEKLFELRLQPLSPGAYTHQLELAPDVEALLAPTAELLGETFEIGE